MKENKQITTSHFPSTPIAVKPNYEQQTSNSVLLRMRNASHKLYRKSQTHFMFNNFYFENLAFYEKVQKKIVQPDNTAPVRCRVDKQGHRHTLQIYYFFTVTMVARKCFNVRLHVQYTACFVCVSYGIRNSK
jgi:hypothetical protein